MTHNKMLMRYETVDKNDPYGTYPPYLICVDVYIYIYIYIYF